MSQRDSYLRRKYGITLAQYNALLKRQGGGCALCLKKPVKGKPSHAVDHDHKTGAIRGILCAYCNHRVVGRHRDPDLLHRMAAYISQDTGWYVPQPKRKRR